MIWGLPNGIELILKCHALIKNFFGGVEQIRLLALELTKNNIMTIRYIHIFICLATMFN